MGLSVRLQGGNRARAVAAAFAGAAVLSGCASLPSELEHAAPRLADQYGTALSFNASAATWPGDRWWAAYGDEQLTTLIEEGLKGTPDLRAAEARLLRARALAQQEGARLAPSLDGNASLQATKQSYNLGLPAPLGWQDAPRATLDFSWELDFWGKNRAALRAATSEAEAARTETAAARLTLSTSIATAYADLAALYVDRDAAADAGKIRVRSTALVQERRANGLENQGALERAHSAQQSAEADLASIDEAIGLNRDRIAALLGAGPDRGAAIARPQGIAVVSPGLPANLAAELLGRRPDIVAARLRTEAAATRIKAAKAAFYPNINLSAFIGLQSLTLGSFAKSGSLVGSAGPAINLPIFHGGQLRGQYREAEANYDLAVAQYDGTVTQALREVSDAAVSGRALGVRLERARAAQLSAQAAWQVATNRYRGGLAPYLDVLTAEDSLVTARRTQAGLQARSFTLDVTLVRALGGGFRF